MIYQGRIPLNDAENDAINDLLAGSQAQAGFSRRDPEESGPVIVTVTDELGEKVFLVHEDGKSEVLS